VLAQHRLGRRRAADVAEADHQDADFFHINQWFKVIFEGREMTGFESNALNGRPQEQDHMLSDGQIILDDGVLHVELTPRGKPM
jgi:hypothetical protein